MFEKILIFAQVKATREAIAIALADTYSTICVQDEHTAIQEIKNNSDIRILLIDLENNDFVAENFIEIFNIHSTFRKIKIIVFGGANDQELIARCLEKGASDFVIKPLDAGALKILLSMHINQMSDTVLEDALEDTNVMFNRLFNDSPIGVAITRISKISEDKLRTVIMNPAYAKIIGRKNERFSGLDWQEITHPDDVEISRKLYEKLERGEINSYTREKRYIRPDGSIVWVNMIVSAFASTNPHELSFISFIQDITENRKINTDLAESERSKSVLLSHLPGLAYHCDYDRDWTMRFVSQGCKKLTGYDPEDLIDNKVISYNDLMAPESHYPIWQEWKRVLAKRLPFTYEYQIITKEGVRKWVLELGEGVFDDDGQVIALEGIIVDIDYLKQMEEKIRYNADFDEATKLHNRNYLERLLDTHIKQGRTTNKALFGINLNTIQALILARGYHYGMDLIHKIADELKAFTSENFQLFLTHENRFCFYIQKYENKEELIRFNQKITKVLEPILLMERISCGIGILEITNAHYESADQILKDTLVATERALLRGDEDSLISYTFFDQKMLDAIEREKTLKSELLALSTSADDSNLILHFQPVMDLKTDKVVSFEALVRFQSPTLGLIPPLEFIPLLEKTKLIIPIGEMILGRALRFLKKLEKNGFTGTISINVSAVQLLSQDFAFRAIQKIRDINVDPNKIWLEITESVFANNYQVINEVLGHVIDLGVHITIDDFGTGYSSLYRLLRLNTNGLKIDRAFIDGIELVDEHMAITQDIISLGKKLNYLIVAEGIENEKQLHYLKGYNCDYGQGYLFSRPLDEEHALEYFIKHS
ncbi:MAG: EAL domain-containing protein [Bacilli bacterium]